MEERRELEIEAVVEGRTVRIVLGAAEFSRMSWVLHKLGPKAIIYPGQQQHARAAIQSLSSEIRRERIFAHLGWRKHGESWVYLEANGAVGSDGPNPGLSVRLSDPLKLYQTRQPENAEFLRSAVRSSLSFLSVAPDRITIPLLASVYRAPLGPVDFSLYFAGRTGTFKTALAALAQQHFGAAMNAAHLPANFASTASALEEIAFEAKDSLLVIDDFVPSGRSSDDALQNLAERVFRAAGNRQGRSRMSGQGLRAARPPRAFLLATGEEVPQGHSVRARLLILELHAGDVDPAMLTRSQKDADEGQFATAMGGYLTFVASRYEEIQRCLKTRVRERRQGNFTASVHARLPEMIAELASGWEIFLDFAEQSDAIHGDTRTQLEQRAGRAFEEVAAMQACYHRASDPARGFLSLLQAALAAGIAHVADRHGGAPEAPELWGWRHQADRFVPEGDRIGWVSGADLFLDPVASYRAAREMAGSEHATIGAPTIRRRLHERGLLRSVDAGRQMLLVRRILSGSSREVLHLSANDVIGPADPKRVRI
jgi:hypothetical protein